MDALEELQQIEDVGVDTRISELQDAWAAIIARAEKESVDVDVLRAEALAHAANQKLTHEEISLAIKISQSYVVYLLRYHRFLVTMVTKIPERRFRAYWAALSDPREQTRDPVKRAAYEESVFRHIAKQIEDGIPPQKHPRTIKPVTHVDIRKKADPLAAYKKEVEKNYEEKIAPVIKDLIALSKADRSTFAPSIMGGLGSKLERLYKESIGILAPPRD